jgi:DNA-directed RNA polymerase subunit K/omega
MIYSPLDELLPYADNNSFTLATIAAKRAHQIMEERRADDERSSKAVTLAFEDIINGRIKFKSTKTGIK